MKDRIYFVLIFVFCYFSQAQDYRQIDSLADSLAKKAYTEIDLYGRLKGSDGPREYITNAYYDSISVKTENDVLRLYFMVLDYVKHDSAMTMFTCLPDYYCVVSSTSRYFFIKSEVEFGKVVVSLQPIDNPQKAEFLAIVYTKCLKGVSHYKANDPNCSISTVFQNNEYITTISEKVYDSYWNDFIKHEKVFRITPKGVYSMDETEVEKK